MSSPDRAVPGESQASIENRDGTPKPFPWNAGIYDAHCHPTDTMASIASIPSMRARILTIMATRSQDQHLVASVASAHGLGDHRSLLPPDQDGSSPAGKVVPAFGWHPWFSYQLFDDTDPAAQAQSAPPTSSPAELKARHYMSVLSPTPEHGDFVKSLPEPQSLSSFISQTRRLLIEHPNALVGEIGLDKAFRLPEAWAESESSPRDEGLTAGGREGRRLSPYHVRVPHQVKILKAQLKLAGELGRAVSLHGVQAHGVLYEALASTWRGHEKEVVSRKERRMVAQGAEDFFSSDDDNNDEEDCPAGGTEGPGGAPKKKAVKPKPYPPRICLHSFSGAAPVLKQYLNPSIPARIFFSFSSAVNLSTTTGESKFSEVIRACPDDQLLVESDLHTAGERMDLALEDMYRRICDIKGWTLEDGAERIGRNFEEFIFG